MSVPIHDTRATLLQDDSTARPLSPDSSSDRDDGDGSSEEVVISIGALSGYRYEFDTPDGGFGGHQTDGIKSLYESGYDDDDEETYVFGSYPRRRSHPALHTRPPSWLCLMAGLSCTMWMYITYPTPSTIPIFVGFAVSLVCWVTVTWTSIVMMTWTRLRSQRSQQTSRIWSKWTNNYRIRLAVGTIVVAWWTAITMPTLSFSMAATMTSMSENVTPLIGTGEKYFIAVTLHNNEAIMWDFITELTSLAFHLGRHDIYISIYESNSEDDTKTYLHGFDHSLTELGIAHRIEMVDQDPDSKWAYGTSSERISFLSKCRNKAMEPLQSPDEGVRIPDRDEYTKVIFLNDIRFKWQDIVSLILTALPNQEGGDGEGYDLACAMDFGSSGLYDTWVARDICGTPFRAFWPYVADPQSQVSIRKEEPFEVSACWNGAVVFDARPFLYQLPNNDTTTITSPGGNHRRSKRGWKMIDNLTYSDSRSSPPITQPIQFRTSGIEACDHSECFLFSYDLHRYYAHTPNRPRIIMNPGVKVAYDQRWWYWNNVVLGRPVVQWWQSIWSHRISYWFFDYPFEHFGRRRDYCTWAGLKIPVNSGRCRALPGPEERHWDKG